MRSLENHSPAAVITYYLCAIGVCMFCRDLIITSISLFFAVLFYFAYGGGGGARFHVFAAVFAVLMIVINPFFYHGGSTVLFVFGDNPVTLEALVYGACTAQMIISVVYWFYTFSRIMTEDKLLSLIGRFSPKFSLMLSMVIRFVPLFSRHLREVNSAQRVLGAYKENNVVDSLRAGARAFSGTAGWALENGITTADSMEARGYGAARRTSFSLYRSRIYDAVLMMISLFLLGGVIYGAVAGGGFVFYPSISVPGGVSAAILYTFYGVLCALPSIFEISERLKWKYLRSKI